MVDKITISTRMPYQDVVTKLGKLGGLRVDNQYEKNGIKYVLLRGCTLVERLSDAFSRDRSAAKKSVAAVLNALEPLIKNLDYSDQFFQNIRDRTDQGYGFSGRNLRRDLQPVTEGGRPMPLRGGTVAALSKGNSVQILEADSAKIK